MLRTAVIGLLIVSLAGCSQLQILYGNGAYLIESNVENYLNQTEEDRLKLKNNIERLLKWHRTEMLVSYSKFLDEQIFILKKTHESFQISKTNIPNKRLQDNHILLQQHQYNNVHNALPPMDVHTKLFLTDKQNRTCLSSFPAAQAIPKLFAPVCKRQNA